ncbi:MAG: AmmeMemoRadiSam system radical SAM enzyme [Candidatus Altiarchaeota archaeon]|nr:AmmeMemoRadiSam system radical SAM enzyme [Candidatus Altiarchaeota archaeon]
MKEASLYKKRGGKKVKCYLCNQNCTILDGRRGLCGVRENQGGTLYSLVYGKLIASHVDPIEKKPLYHFLPGTKSFSIATVGCNFTCKFCQNADISQMPRDQGMIRGEDWSAKQVVEETKRNECSSIAYTYTEPTIFFEFARDCGLLAKKEGIANVFVSNGYMTGECIDAAKGWLDAANIDLKAFSDKFYRATCGARLEPILDSLKYLKKSGIWVEVTTLVIPKMNDSDEELRRAAEFIAGELGKDTPWHLSAFHPDYRMLDSPSTPLKTLLRARELGEEAGLEYIYIGNVHSDEGSHTKCPGCGGLLIKRSGFDVVEDRMKGNKCPGCGRAIAGFFKP